MNEFIRQNIGDLLQLLNILLKEGIDVSKDGLPVLLEQMLSYGIRVNTMCLWVSLGIFLATIIFIVIRLVDGEYLMDMVFGVAFIGIPSFVFFIFSWSKLIKIKSAPILYLIESVRWFL